MGPAGLRARTVCSRRRRRRRRAVGSPGRACRESPSAQAAEQRARRGAMKGPSPSVLREGELEKRSASLFQLWKKKQAVLSPDCLSLCSPEGGKARAKELRFGAIRKVDCVERTGKYVYFTIVTTDRQEIDFRCPGESGWNASITLALIAFQNQRAVRDFKSRQEAAEHAADGTRDRRLARAP